MFIRRRQISFSNSKAMKSMSHSKAHVIHFLAVPIISSLLAACGGGPIEDKGLPSSLQNDPISENRNEKPDRAEKPSGNENSNSDPGTTPSGQTQSDGRGWQNENALKLGLTADGKAIRLLAIGLDHKSGYLEDTAVADPSRIDSRLFSPKEVFVSLSGRAVQDYYRQNCPVVAALNVQDYHPCVAGLYYGRTPGDRICYTYINSEGYVQHVSDDIVIPWFKPKGGFEFTRADAGDNTFVRIQGSTDGYHVTGQRIILNFDFQDNYLQIWQENHDESFGPKHKDLCTVRFETGSQPRRDTPA